MSIGLAQLGDRRGLRISKESTLPVGLVDLPPFQESADAVSDRTDPRRSPKSARLKLAGLLMKAQEVERSRIARELHDDVGQSIAIVGVQLQRTALLIKGVSKEGDAQLEDLLKKIRLLGHRVSTLSHQLHSSELEFLGLAAAAKGLCREFSEHYGIEVSCKCGRISPSLNADIALSLFRVLQESFRNVTKHSHARNVEVELCERGGSLCLKFLDDGEGFDSDRAFESQGLGLTSMRERICLLGGSFEILSERGFGAKIEVRVPLFDMDGIPQC